VKCVVWDLDGTLWPDTALERAPGEALPVPDTVALELVRALRARGILNALATRNPPALRDELLLEPWSRDFAAIRAGWGAKAPAIAAIAGELEFTLDQVVYVDEEPFQRASVEHELPGVCAFDVAKLRARLELLRDRPLTAEATRRTERYQDAARRKEAARAWNGDRDGFLASCGIVLTLGDARVEDAKRVAELLQRTTQYNSTGLRWSSADVLERVKGDGTVLVGRLCDRFGDYGLVATAVISREVERWTVDVLLVSCRVAGRGCLEGVLDTLARRARDAGASELVIPLTPTDRNLPLRLALRAVADSMTVDDENVVRFTIDVAAGRSLAPAWLAVDVR
jgi:methoxymalonate biosynthesis protein